MHLRHLQLSLAQRLGRKLGVPYGKLEHEQKGQQYIKETFIMLTTCTGKALKSIIGVKKILPVGS